jgi:polar amino acid transport system substrate-binding protein
MATVTPEVRSQFAPAGTLRVGLNMSNFLLTATGADGKPKGIAADLGRELGQRLGVPVELVPYPNPGALADAAKAGAWDVGFLGAEPQRANEIDFTAAYVEIEATYLVPAGSPIKAIADVDRPGARIAISVAAPTTSTSPAS